MKILLITLPRTGSNSLLKKIAKKENLLPINEPFISLPNKLKQYENFDWKNTDNLCVKTHINHMDILFYLKFVQFFDKVILVSRKDLKACAESLSYAHHFKNFSDKYVWTITPNFKNTMKFVEKIDKDLRKLSKLINIDILYYEDLFDVKSEDRLRSKNIAVKLT
jgi:hypothetical protein